MAENDKKDRDLPPRDFIDALVEDPANPPQLQVLTGYRGRSAQEGHTRFYVDPVLTAWADVPDDAILFQHEIQDEVGLSKSLVWTRLDAQIQIGPQAGGGTGADFLQGQVAQDLGGGTFGNVGNVGNIGNIGNIGGVGTPLLRTPIIVCPTQPPFCIVPTQSLQCAPSLLIPCISQQIACPTQDPNQCVLQTASPLQCPSLGITCTALPPCPPRTVPPACPPTPGIGCIPSVLIACPPITQDPNQCVLQTANPLQCPSLGITCTALPPCPPRTAPPACPPTPGIACIPSVLIACPPITQDPRQCVLQTQNVAQCIPRPTSSPQLCPVATPNPGCVPGFPGGPGGPLTPQVLVTNEPLCDPASSFCPTTPFTPNQGFGGFGQGFQGAEGMGAAAVGGPAPVPQTLACPSQFAACTQLCPAPNTLQLTCPVTRNVQCFTSRLCPRSTFCPSVSVPCQTGAVCQPVTLGCPFGGGGGFGGGF